MSLVPILQGSNEAILAIKTLEDQLSNIFDAIEKSISTTSASNEVENYSCCGTYLDITSQIPYWVVQEKIERGGEALTIFDFVQKYYDWLYCEESCGGSDYVLENKLLDIIDIEKTTENYHKRLYYTYFPEYRDDEVLSGPDGVVTDETVAKFVKNIKAKFYIKKGSLESLKIFFKSLFSIDDPLVRYPKKQILRLNAGAFQNSNFKFSGSTFDQTLELAEIENEIVGSYLNHNVMQDGSLFTDYSYVININENTASYAPLFKRTIHAAGLNGFFEINLDNYEPPGSTYIDDADICQVDTVLNNYSPYTLNTTYTVESFFLRSSSGISYYGLTYTRGCTLSDVTSLPFGGTACHFFPTWATRGQNYTSFFDIPMREMFTLCRINTNINPNLLIPNC